MLSESRFPTSRSPVVPWRMLLLIGAAFIILLATGGLTEDKRKQRTAGVIYIDCNSIVESSGIAVSTRDPQILWTHNDSGDRPRLFAVNRIGKLVAEVAVESAEARDWEDLCSFEMAGSHWLAIGDCGDNERKRQDITIYFVEEPLVPSGQTKSIRVAAQRTLKVRYPGDRPLDCEAIAYDPLTSCVLLCSKETYRTQVFQVPVPQEKGLHHATAQRIGVLGLPWVTAADISRDGQRFVIATYGPGGILIRSADQKNGQRDWGLSNPTKLRTFELPARFQGESVCFDPLQGNLILTSEGTPTPLHFVPIPEKTSAP